MSSASLLLPGSLLASASERSINIAPSVDMLSGVDGLAALEVDWRRLSASAPAGGAFLGFGFALSAARYHEERGERVVVASVSSEGSVQCILPVALTRQGRVSVAVFLGDPIAQYGDALLGADAPARFLESALTALRQRADIDVFAFRRVRGDSAMSSVLEREARPQGTVVGAPFADLRELGSSAAMLQAAGAKQKREQARCRRRLAEFGEVRFEVRRGESAIEWVREALELKAARLAQAGSASPVVGDPRAMEAFERAASDREDGQSVTAFKLSVGGRAAAIEFGLVRGRRFHAYLGVTEEAFASVSPGRLIMEDVVDWCAAHDIDTLDLLPPADAYKRLWSNGSVDASDFVLATTWTGALYAGPWLKWIRPRLRKMLAKLPPALRKRAGAVALRAGAR